MVEIIDSRLKFVPLEEATVPPGGLIECFKDRWWTYVEGKGILYWKSGKDHYSPQCNSDQKIAVDFNQKMYPWAESKLIPFVFRRINPRNY